MVFAGAGQASSSRVLRLRVVAELTVAAGGAVVAMVEPEAHWVARAQFQGFSPGDESLRRPFSHAYGAVRMWRRTSSCLGKDAVVEQ
eukprot:COSAG05_NODE_1875_length_3915_cov_2.417977_1_plen_87_part_00